MSRPDRVWLLRHAETTAPHVFNGADSDVDLSELGVRQAAAAGEWFRQHRPTAVVSSAMRRAISTARPIADVCGVGHSTIAALHERRIGPLAGQPFALDAGPWPETVRQWTAGNAAFTSEGAESFDDLTRRLLPAWEQAMAGHAGGRVVVVAHGIVCKVLLLNLLDGWDVRGWVNLGRAENVSVTELRPAANGKWLAESLLTVPEPVRAVTDVSRRLRSEA